MLALVNRVVVCGSMLFALVALFPSAGMYAQLYAARAVPLGLVVLYALSSRAKPGLLLPMLTVAGLVQAIDVVIGLGQGIPGMAAGAAVAAAVHLSSAWLLRARRPATATI